jgi:hypothetical protein
MKLLPRGRTVAPEQTGHRRSASAPARRRSTLTRDTDYKDVKECGVRFIIRKFSKSPRFIHIDHTSCHSVAREGGWLGLWSRECGPAIPLCSFEGCPGASILGAHVRYAGSTARYGSWYIAPACSACNRQRARGGKLKPGTRLLKVVDGRVFGKTNILHGRVNSETAAALIGGAKAKGEHASSLADGFRTWSRGNKAESAVREWPRRRLFGWGWR